MGRFAGRLPTALLDDFTGTMNLLRNPRFQDTLVNYPRAKRPFWVALEAKDEVSSARIDRSGKFKAPEDYLEAFSRFVKENADRVDALNILLRRPQGWCPAAFGELRRVMGYDRHKKRHTSGHTFERVRQAIGPRAMSR
jgi:type I restriction enzyme R subunit